MPKLNREEVALVIYRTKLAEGRLGGNKRPRKRPSDLGLGYCRLTGMDVCEV